MSGSLGSVGDRLRRPEYTGENRCLPCTVVNVIIGVVVAAVVGALFGPVGALAALAVSLGAVYFRGYLVPGTPTLTMRYLPPRVLELFGKELRLPETLDPLDGVAVRATPEGGRLVGSFASAWRDRIETMRADGVAEDDVATLLGVADASKMDETAFVVDGGLRQWLSESAILADAAAAAVLAGDEAWAELDADARVAALRDLRKYLDRCPLCDGQLHEDRTETVETCCTESERVLTATCSACDTRLIEDVGDQ
ncbi:MAG: hypothetical protein ABEJ82_01400 [Haloplanus sp.]